MKYYGLDNPTFEQWLKRPVYVVQCHTMRRARDLCGLVDGQYLPIDKFRCLPGYRDRYAQTLRNMVALSIRMDRLKAKAQP